MGAEALSDALLVLPFSCPDRAALSPRNVDRVLPIDTEGRADGGTDYYIDPETATSCAAAREHPDAPKAEETNPTGHADGPAAGHPPRPNLVGGRLDKPRPGYTIPRWPLLVGGMAGRRAPGLIDGRFLLC